MADDVAALVHALDLDRPLICGYSDGANIVLEVGMRYPDQAAASGDRCSVAPVLRELPEFSESIRILGPGTVEFEMLETAATELVEVGGQNTSGAMTRITGGNC